MIVCHLWYVIIFVKCLPGDAEGEANNRCRSSENNGSKTWGPSCQRECHCKRNEPCDSVGYCANGCEGGWRRNKPNGRCTPVILWKLFARQNRSNQESVLKDTVLRLKRNPRSQTNAVIYRFYPDQMCILDENGSPRTRWHTMIETPVVVKVVKINFDTQLRENESIRCTFHIKSFSNNSITKILTKSHRHQRNMFSMTIIDFIIADSFSISLTSRDDNSSCSPIRLKEFVVQALPVCPYRKWGLPCNNDCQCPCAVRECHPTTGSCLEPGFACPPGMYGPSCGYQCSPRCYGYLHQCHVLTGICKDCNQSNLTGVNCQTVLSPAQQASRIRICEHISSRTVAEQIIHKINNVSMRGNDRNTRNNNQYTVFAFMGLTFLSLSILSCCYLQIMHKCAKRRMKEHVQMCLNEDCRQQTSMATYTEFKKEFIEMEEFKRLQQSPGLNRHSVAYSLKTPSL